MCSLVFVFSCMCSFEFDHAYHHYVAIKKTRRLIVLMMLDNPMIQIDENCKSLRQYLSHYTYIDYNSEDWFDRLLYALPVTGMLQRLQQAEDDDVPLLDEGDSVPIL